MRHIHLHVSYGLLVICALLFGVILFVENTRSVGHTSASTPVSAYSTHPERYAEWGGPVDSSIARQIQNAAPNISYVVLENALNQTGFTKHFGDVAAMASAAQGYGNQIRIFEYFNSTVWYSSNATTWAPYSNSFSPTWYLHDASGNAIGHTVGGTTNGYWIDETNPAYRSWAVQTITSWMQSAPYKGVALDSADLLVGSSVRGGFGGSSVSLNQLLCGAGAPVDSAGNCARVAAWNDGLTTLVSQVSQALHGMGDEVIYNGIAPSALRTSDRNIGLLTHADMASNESFCYDVTPGNAGQINYESFTNDAAIMQQQAAAGKKIMQITNYLGNAQKISLAPYCLAGFYMGWQPGSSLYAYHRDYNSALTTATYPEIPEQNLNLGNPTGSYAASGAILYRNFQNGFVAVNASDSSTNVTLPAKLIEYTAGTQHATYAAGTSFTVPGRSGAFFLLDSYINPAEPTAPGESNPGTNPGTNPQTQLKPTLPVQKKVTGTLQFAIADGANYTKVEYLLDGKIVHVATQFPDKWSLATTTLKNGTHTLVTKYFKKDGTIALTSQKIVVANPKTFEQKLVSSLEYTAIIFTGLLIVAAGALYVLRPNMLKNVSLQYLFRRMAAEKPVALPTTASAHQLGAREPGDIIHPADPTEKH